MRIVLDANALVSGLLSAGSPPGRIVDLVLGARPTLLFDDRILGEYEEVLARPRLRIAPAHAAAVLDLLRHEGILTPAPPLDVELPDPDDLPFLEVAVAGGADALVTGNERHFRPLRGDARVPVLPPVAFLDRWRALHPHG